MKILVSGGAGFIGSQIVDAYLRERHELVVIDDLSRGKKKNLAKKAKFYQIDICDQKKLNQILEKEKPEIINHHAAQVELRKSISNPQLDVQINILGSINLLESAIKIQVKKFIFASTGGALYGEQKKFPADETHPIQPLSPYGIAKRAVELYLYYYHQVHNLEYVSLRYSNVYGPRQDPYGEAGVVAIFCEKLWGGALPKINGDGEQTRDFVYVQDVVEANVLALKQGVIGEFNIGTGKESSVNQIYKILSEIIGSKITPQYGPGKKGEQMRSALDPALAQKALGWKPKITLEQGLKLTAEFFKPKS